MVDNRQFVELMKRVCGTTNYLDILLRSGYVGRYHTEPHMTKQQISNHTWRALILLLHLWPDASRELILALLYHDCPEVLTGDIHGVFKRHPAVSEVFDEFDRLFHKHMVTVSGSDLTDIDRAKLKCVDILEGILFVRGHPGYPGKEDLLKRFQNHLLSSGCLEELEEDDHLHVLNIVGE